MNKQTSTKAKKVKKPTIKKSSATRKSGQSRTNAQPKNKVSKAQLLSENTSLGKSLPHMLGNTFVALPHKNALCEKRKQWQCHSSPKLAQRIEHLALGLKKMGVKKGDNVGLIAPSSPQWLIYDQAIMSCGAVTVAMFENVSDVNLKYQLKEAQINIVLLSGKAAFVKCASEPSLVKKVIYDGDEKAIADLNTDVRKARGKAFKKAQTVPLKKVTATGEAIAKKKPKAYSTMVDAINPDDLASIVYTSGTLGSPKGVMLSHRAFLEQVRESGVRYKLFSERDVALSYLPLAHIFERMIIYLYLSRGLSVYFCNDIEKLGEMIREVKPTIMTTVPRVLEKIQAKVNLSAQSAPGLKGVLARTAINRAETLDHNRAKEFLDNLLDKLVYTKIRKNFGGNFRYIISGGAPLDMETYQFFTNIGFSIFEGYGLTEAAPVVASNYPGNVKVGTVGKIYGNTEAMIDRNGELLVRATSLMDGYYKKNKLNRQIFNKAGWMYTGDLASLDKDNYLTIKGRAKDLLKTAYGKYVAPTPIEQKLAQLPKIEHALVVADKRPFTTAILFTMENTKEGEAEMAAQLQPSIDKINQRLEDWEKIKKIAVVKRTLTIDAGDLTPKMNIRRAPLEASLKTEITVLYGEKAVKKRKPTARKKPSSKSKTSKKT